MMKIIEEVNQFIEEIKANKWATFTTLEILKIAEEVAKLNKREVLI